MLIGAEPSSGTNEIVSFPGPGTLKSVGRPLGLLLTRKQENETVTLTHTGTKDLTVHTRNADIVVAAIGQAHFLKAEMIKEGAVVIDVGISRTPDGLQGDVCPGVFEKASYVATTISAFLV